MPLVKEIVDDDRWRLPPYRVDMLDVQVAFGQTIDYGLKLSGIPNAWKTTKGKGIRVGICDTGSPQHGDVITAVVTAKDFTGSSSGYVDMNGHGSHVAGILAARDNETGLVGVAPECEIVCAKVLGDDGSGSSMSVAAGIDWCVAKECQIINMSLGSSRPDQSIQQAVIRARAKGVFIFAAAGNEGPGENTMGYPGRWDECVAVGSINQQKQVSRFSSRGQQMDIAFAGEKVTSTYLNGTYSTLSGTSMSCPGAAGCGALILAWQKQTSSTPIVTVDQMIAVLAKNAMDLGKPGKDTETGYGVIDLGKFPDLIPTPPNGGNAPMDFFMKYIWPLILKLLEQFLRGDSAGAETTFGELKAKVEENRVAIKADWSKLKGLIRLVLPWIVSIIEAWLNEKPAVAQAEFKKLSGSTVKAAAKVK